MGETEQQRQERLAREDGFTRLEWIDGELAGTFRGIRGMVRIYPPGFEHNYGNATFP